MNSSTPAAGSEGLAALGVIAATEAIHNGEFAAESYSAALLQRARSYSYLNSFISIDESGLLAAARKADKARAQGSLAPLLGVPLGVKDSYMTCELPTTLGAGILGGFVPALDADIVSTIKHAGSVVFGKNNLVEMSYGLTGSNFHHGQVNNPYALGHISGGSSSGSAASVAARIVPGALGGDTVGSIRVPASLCGVVGFRPTTGRWPRDGVAPISSTLDTTGILARTVADCALIDRIVTKETEARFNGSGLRETKFVYAPRQYLELIDNEVEARFNATLELLRDAGAEIIEIDLGEDFSLIAERSTWNIFFYETMQTIPDFLRRYGFPVSFEDIYNQLEPGIKEVWSQAVLHTGADSVSSDAYETAMYVHRPEIRRRFDDVLARYGNDAFLFPTTPCVAPSIEEQHKFSIGNLEVSYLELAKNTIPTSTAGLPGISIPMGLSGAGLPIGIEIDGVPAGDRRLLDLAARVEAAIGWLPAPDPLVGPVPKPGNDGIP
ncbi:amidase family protein [Mycobacterium paraintracellulare]|uniref:amidase family protein n=1 Tax=Mycobacterium paraintracellulare TaxID=1138383 RepID=UPI001916B7FE|nr:amidase family protein [Mycobacterium paraintracellulare]